jgi:uncharacterized damage-inducible protein DinB
MTLQELKLLHAFNSWATNRIFNACETMSSEDYHRDLKASHKSIHLTMVHMVGAEKIWLARWLGTPDQSFLSEKEAPDLATLRALWEKTGFETAQFLGTMSDKKLLGTFTMKTLKGEQVTHTYWQAFQHVVDHSTYHRGQVVAMMRQLGTPPPSTGLITFYRETAKLGSA